MENENPGNPMQPRDLSENPAAGLKSLIDANWANWVGSPKGLATLPVLVDSMANPNYRGETAAALAALSRYIGKNPAPPIPINPGGWSKAEIDELFADSGNQAEKELVDWYAAYTETLKGASYALYATGKPDFTSLQQGPDGDCFFFSGVGWLAKYRPQVIMDAIQPGREGFTYRVAFADGNSANFITPPTDCEKTFFNSAASCEDGLWITVLEKGFGQVYSSYVPGKDDKIEPIDNIARGGKSAITQKIFTGNDPNCYNLKEEGIETVRMLLQEMKEENRMTQAGVGILPTPIPKIGENHSYAVLDFDGDIVTVWNPWGDNFKAAEPPGLVNGYTQVQGVFQIPLEQFMEVFSSLVIENPGG